MKKRILIVEDEAEYLKIISYYLEPQHELLLAKNGNEAIQYFKETKFDLALIDYCLPDFNAIELVKKMQAISYKDLPDIIIMSTFNEPADVIEAMIDGLAYDFLLKPFEKETLLKTVEKAINRKAEEFIQKLNYQSKLEYINMQILNLKLHEYKNLLHRFGETAAKERSISIFKGIKNLSVVLRILQDDTGEIAPLMKPTNILVIEDEEPMRQALKIILEDRFNVVFAATGQEGLNQIEQISDLDIILLDIGLPDMNGLEILKSIHKKKSTFIPDVIALTAYSDEATIKEICRNGACAYITKVSGNDAIIETVSQIAEQRYYFKTIPPLLEILKNQTPSFKTRLHLLNRKIIEASSPITMADIYRYFPETDYPPNMEIPHLTIETGLREFILMLKNNMPLQPLSIEIEGALNEIMIPYDQLKHLYLIVVDSNRDRQASFEKLFISMHVIGVETTDQLLQALSDYYGNVPVIILSDDRFEAVDTINHIIDQLYQFYAKDPCLYHWPKKIVLTDQLDLESQFSVLKNYHSVSLCLAKTSNEKEIQKAVFHFINEKIKIDNEISKIKHPKKSG